MKTPNGTERLKYLWNEDKNGTSGEGMKYEDDIIPGLDDLTKADGTDNLQIGALTDAWRFPSP